MTAERILLAWSPVTSVLSYSHARNHRAVVEFKAKSPSSSSASVNRSHHLKALRKVRVVDLRLRADIRWAIVPAKRA